MRRHGGIRALIAFGIVLGATAMSVAATSGGGSGRIGPPLKLTGNGRLLSPAARLVTLGHFPTGGALTPDGRFYWTVSTGRGLNDVRIVSMSKPHVVQVVPLPGASGGIAIDRTQPLVYVSGVADSTN